MTQNHGFLSLSITSIAFASEFKLFRALTTSSGVLILLEEFFFPDKINTAGYFISCFYHKDMRQQDRRLQKSLLRGAFGRSWEVGIRTSDARNVAPILSLFSWRESSLRLISPGSNHLIYITHYNFLPIFDSCFQQSVV